MKKMLSAALAGVLALSLAACGGSSAPATTAAPAAPAATEAAAPAGGAEAAAPAAEGAVWKIGGMGPVTGPAAVYGAATQQGQELAAKEINEAGGINGYQIEVNYQDDEHDAEKAINAYNSLKDWGMQMLVGATTSAPTIAVGAEAANDNMFILTPSGTALEITEPRNVFRVCFSDPAQGTKSAEYIGSHDLPKKVAAIYDSSDVYSSGIHDAFIAEAANQGIEVVADEQYTGDSNTDFSTQIQKFKDAGAELVFLPIYYSDASKILTQAKQLGFETKYFGCDGMDGILNVENFDTSLAEGLMLLTPFSADAEDELTQNFVKNYEAAYGGTPIQFAADSYDGMFQLKAALEAGNADPSMSASEICDILVDQMPKIKIEHGLTGEDMTFTEEGEPNKAPKAVVIEGGVYKSIE